MRRSVCVLAVPVLSLAISPNARAQDAIVPAGTLLRCTMNEPNLSSATAQVGDPVLCHLGSVSEFGRNVFPRGAYMSGHLEADKEPGHFVGKGYLKLVFDRIGTPNADVNVDAKVVAARGYHVDKEGDIRGKGHAKRDVIEWMFPPLWPWKVIMLPARGPRPALKGEETLTLRLMEDVTILRMAAAYNSRDWRSPQAQIHERPSVYQYSENPLLDLRHVSAQTATAPSMGTANTRYVVSVDPGFHQPSQLQADPQPAAAPDVPAAPAVSSRNSRDSSASLTLIAMHNETIWAVSAYWLDGDRLDYILPGGSQESCALNDVDLMRTTQLNSERGVTVAFHEAPPHQPAL